MSIEKPQLAELIDNEEELSRTIKESDKCRIRDAHHQFSEVITPKLQTNLQKLSTKEIRNLLITILIKLRIDKCEIARILKIHRSTVWNVENDA